MRDSINEGRYRIIEKLGRGGQSVVYKAEDTSDSDRIVALKVLSYPNVPVHKILKDPAYERFRREYYLTAKLLHPQISTVFHHGIDRTNGVAFAARPYLKGMTLTEKINDIGAFMIDDATKVILSLADALDFIHKKKVVHCDIKPSNIFMVQNLPVLIDFGLAYGKDVTGIFVRKHSGTLAYLAPEVLEQPRNRELVYGVNRDWWALGCVAHDMVTGRRMYAESAPEMVSQEIRMGKEQELIERNLTGSAAYPLVKALLQRDPSKRARSRYDLERALGRF